MLKLLSEPDRSLLDLFSSFFSQKLSKICLSVQDFRLLLSSTYPFSSDFFIYLFLQECWLGIMTAPKAKKRSRQISKKSFKNFLDTLKKCWLNPLKLKAQFFHGMQIICCLSCQRLKHMINACSCLFILVSLCLFEISQEVTMTLRVHVGDDSELLPHHFQLNICTHFCDATDKQLWRSS